MDINGCINKTKIYVKLIEYLVYYIRYVTVVNERKYTFFSQMIGVIVRYIFENIGLSLSSLYYCNI